jgi:hypothetical protein
MRVRDHALENFSGRNVRPGRPLATLEEVLVPLYLLHRYQVHAAGKLIGGQRYAYAMRGDGQPPVTAIGADRQRDAIAALLQTMEPAFLSLPDRIVRLLPPRPPGFIRSRESFPRHTGVSFDPAGAADSAVALTLAALLDPKRAARLIRQHAVDDSMPGFTEVCEYLLGATWQAGRQEGMHGLIQRRSNLLYLEQLMRLSVDPEAGPEVRATAIDTINRIDDWLSARTQREPDAPWRAAYSSARQQIARFRDDPSFIEQLVPVTVPPGSPIGGAPGW